MIDPIVIPEQQFSDADGHPYAGGSIASYIPGTSTPKTTWQDPNQTAANTNPVILDSAGRCILYGDGDYRLILRDAAGNLVWDITASSIASAAMAPVVAAPTITDALHLLGIDSMFATEAAARDAAIAAEATARNAAILVETNRAVAAETTLQTNITAEQTRAQAAETAIRHDGRGGFGFSYLIDGNLMQWGKATTAGSGAYTLTFPITFTNLGSIQCTLSDNPINCTVRVSVPSTAGCAVFVEDISNVGRAEDFFWFAVGRS